MRKFFCAFALCSIAASVTAQSPESFQKRAFDAAATPGDTRIPILCGGFYRSLVMASEQGSADQAAFQERQNTSVNIGIAVHMMDTGQEKDAASDFIANKISEVSTIYSDWFVFNQQVDDNPFSDKIRENYGFCEGYYTKWTTAPATPDQ